MRIQQSIGRITFFYHAFAESHPANLSDFSTPTPDFASDAVLPTGLPASMTKRIDKGSILKALGEKIGA
jgi:hypothetical protein